MALERETDPGFGAGEHPTTRTLLRATSIQTLKGEGSLRTYGGL